MNKLAVKSGKYKSKIFLLALVCGLGCLAPSGMRAHSGDNEAFLDSPQSGGPQEVSVDEQGIRALGIKTLKLVPTNLRTSMKATGDVQADETRAFIVNPPVSGLVASVSAKQGDLVKKGQTLAVVHSIDIANNLTQLLNTRIKINADIARTKTQYTSEITLQTNQLQLAKAALEREEALMQEGISARKNYQEAKNSYESAMVRLATLKQRLEQEVALLEKQLAVTINTDKEQLKIMGLSGRAVDEALASGKVTADLSLKAPVSGCVIKRDISLGERIDPGKAVFAIVNLSPIWVMVDIYQEQIPQVKEGQEVLLQTPSKERLAGRISSIGSVVDSATKTLHVRIIADNQKGYLRPGMFVTGEILLGHERRKALTVPETAIVYYKDRPYVYEHHIDEGHFEPAQVVLGEKAGGQVEIVSGLQQGDLIVIAGASQLLAQAIMKPESQHEHKGEKHEDHAAHQNEQTHASAPAVQLITGLGLGIALTLFCGIVWGLLAKWRKPPKVDE